MKKFIFIVLFSALLVSFPRAARADFEDGQQVSAAIVAPLMAWVEKETGVRVPMLPSVIASRSKLLKIVSRMGPLAGRAQALYIGGTVFLDHRLFDTEESTQISLLVHELVHYAQSFRRTPVGACANAKEYEAYTLQNKWLAEQGHAPFVSASWIARMAACKAPSTTIALAQTK